MARGKSEEYILKSKIEQLLTKEYACATEELHGTETIFSIRTDAKQPYIQILAYRHCVVVCASEDLHGTIKGLLAGKSRDEIFELPYVYGQTIHYIPDLSLAKAPLTPPDFECEFLFEQEVVSLRGLTGFGNSLEFEADGSTPTRAVCIAKDNGKIIGAAGAAGSSVEGLWEVGVDVLEGRRNAGVGTRLVRRLTRELLERNILPYYSASVTNLGSQMVASRCGYIPAWVDTFGTTLDGSSVYHEIISGMELPRGLAEKEARRNTAKGMTEFMKKVIVIGSPGAGKSTFARKLQNITGLPLFYLDMIYHRADKTTCSAEEFDEKLKGILERDQWIIDGNYARTLPLRLKQCDTVFWLDYPLEVCLQGIESRFGKPRCDMPWIETEWDEEFLEFVKNFHLECRPEIQRLLREYPEKEIIIFHSREAAEEFLEKERA